MRARGRSFEILFYSMSVALIFLVFFLAPVNPWADSGEDVEDWEQPPTVPQIETSFFTGAATYKIPIECPPGRNGMAPSLSLTYNSHSRNSWLGVGWTLDLGVIQRSTKWGLNYNGTDFVEISDGSAAELVPRSDLGSNRYSRKAEGDFSKYYFDTSVPKWIVTKKDGTIYYYGTMPHRGRKAPGLRRRSSGIWTGLKIQTAITWIFSYTKDQGEVYISRIDYTGNLDS